jgi:hypothetical protein
VPSFSSTLADLTASGPTLQVSVGPSRELITALSGLGQAIASPCTVEALIDTGAHTTVINPETVRRLSIRPVGVVQINTPSTIHPLLCNRFHVNVYFSQSFAVENVFAIEAPMGGLPYQCLIGRDILRHASLLYVGSANQFILTF